MTAPSSVLSATKLKELPGPAKGRNQDKHDLTSAREHQSRSVRLTLSFQLMQHRDFSHDFDPQIGRAIAEVFHAVMAGTRTGARSCRTDDDGGNTPWRTSSE